MAKNNEAKVKFTAETGDLNKAIASANSEMTKLRSELKLNETQAKSTGESMDSLKDRARILGEEYAASQSKVDALSDKLEAAKSIFGENSTEAQKLETQLNNARVAQERIAQQIDATNSAMKSMDSASAQAESALGKLGDEVASQERDLQQLKNRYNEVAAEQGASSTEARQLAAQISKTSGELQENRTKLQQASTAADQFDKSLDGVGDSAKDAGDGLGVMDVALGDFISDTAQSGIQSLLGLEESTRQYRNEQSKLEAVAATSGQSLEGLQQGYSDLYAITADETLASTAVLNMSAMGVSVADQETLVNAAAGAWAAYGDSIPLDGLLESINETTRAGTVTGSFADALNWAAMSSEQWSAALSGNSKAQAAFNKGIADGMTVEDAFNEALAACTTTQERQQLVTSAMDAAYGKLGDTYQTTNADVIAANEATGNLTAAQSELAEAIAPVQTNMTNLIADGLQWLADNLPTLVPLVLGMGAAFATWKIAGLVSQITGMVSAAGGLGAALGSLANPVGIVVAAIGALTAAIIYLWNNNEQFREGVTAAWNAIVAVMQPIIEQIATLVQTYWPIIQQTITNAVNTVWQLIQAAWPTIQTIIQTVMDGINVVINTVWPIVQQIIQTVMTNVQNLIQTAWPAIQGVIQTVMGLIQAFIDNVWPHIQNVIQIAMSVIQQVISVAWPIIQGIFQTAGAVIQTVINTVFPVIQGIITTVMGVIQGVIQTVTGIISGNWSQVWEGISNVASSIWNGISSTISGVINGISSTIGSVINGISSTISSVFNGISSTVSSVWNGIKDTIGGAIQGAQDLVGGAIDKIKGFFNFEFKWPHIPLPHFSISGSVNPLDWLTQGVPRIGIEWYAKGGILEGPTVFGQNGGNLMVGGEAGREVVAPLGDLLGYMIDALDAKFAQSDSGALIDAIEELASRPVVVSVNGRQLALATASDTDRVSGSRQNLVKRGVSLA